MRLLRRPSSLLARNTRPFTTTPLKASRNKSWLCDVMETAPVGGLPLNLRPHSRPMRRQAASPAAPPNPVPDSAGVPKPSADLPPNPAPQRPHHLANPSPKSPIAGLQIQRLPNAKSALRIRPLRSGAFLHTPAVLRSSAFRRTSTAEIGNGARHGEVVQFAKR